MCNKTFFESKLFFLIDVIDIKSDDSEEKAISFKYENRTKATDKYISEMDGNFDEIKSQYEIWQRGEQNTTRVPHMAKRKWQDIIPSRPPKSNKLSYRNKFAII